MVIIAWLGQSGDERDRVVISAPEEENSLLGIQRFGSTRSNSRLPIRLSSAKVAPLDHVRAPT
jgi:hypothetical protein